MGNYFKYLLIVLGFLPGSLAIAVQGITYNKQSPDNITVVHVLTVDPSKVKIVAARAKETAEGLDSVANIARHYNALAAINGGYFKFVTMDEAFGLPAGILKINSKWYGIAFKPRGAIGWDPGTNQVLIDRLQTKSSLIINNKNFPIYAMNQIAKKDKAYLLSDSFGVEFQVAPYTAVTIANGQITQISNSGVASVPKDSYIYHTGVADPNLNNIVVGNKVRLQVEVIPLLQPKQTKQWQDLEYIVGAGPILILDKRVVTDFNKETSSKAFLFNKHARTAIGILPNKHWVLVVIEQQFLTENTGMTIPELAQFMRSLGCVHALNLDGGSSSSIYLDPRISSGFNFIYRPVADAILVLPK
jgi:uncharacterized protein YigE (DUF2233 family)